MSVLHILSVIVYCMVMVSFLSLGCSVNAVHIATRWNPVVMHVVKKNHIGPSNCSGIVPGRTKPLLIQQIMGLSPGAPFIFNIDKWRSIVTSGLFHNLSVQTIDSGLGAFLNISGYEAPSVTLAPEVTISASMDNPEVLGGVRN